MPPAHPQVCRTDPTQKGKYIKIILMLLGTNNTSVIYECANTLTALSSAPTAVKAAANCYCQLLASQSDNNVKLIVLDRLAELKNDHRHVMQELVMDILRAVSTPDLDIRKKTLDLVLDLVSNRNIDEVVLTLKKEITKSQGDAGEKSGEYRQMLVQATHACAVKFPRPRGGVRGAPADGLSRGRQRRRGVRRRDVRPRDRADERRRCGRASILRRLLDSFYTIRSSRVCGTCLWIIGEYSQSATQVEEAFACAKASLGATPFFEPPHAKAKRERVHDDGSDRDDDDGSSRRGSLESPGGVIRRSRRSPRG